MIVVSIQKTNYNVLDWQRALIIRCMTDNPGIEREELAQKLGMTDRTLHRICFKEDINLGYIKHCKKRK